MIMAILCNSYMVDPYFIGCSMRCDILLCSQCMSRCILLPPFFITCSDPTSMREHEGDDVY
jgi:hypothetical protein